MLTVNEKGSIGLIEVIRDLTKQGYECFTPIHDYSDVDLIVLDSSFRTYKVQVKYRELYRNVIEVPFRSVVNGKSVPINFDSIDGWAVYCPGIDKVVYVGKHEVDTSKGSFAFRLTESQNNNGKEKRKLYTEYGVLGEWLKPVVC